MSKSKFLPRTLLLTILLLIFPSISFADISKISILPVDPLTVLPSTLSEQMTLQSQDESGNPIKTTEKVDLVFQSSSPTGQFFTATGNDLSSYKYIGINTTNRNFAYKDSTEGTFTITINATGETTGKTWTANQQIVVSSGASQNTTSGSDNTNTSGDVSGASTVSSGSAPVFGGGSTTNVSSISGQLEVLAGNDRTTSPGSPIWFQATMKKNTTGASPVLSWSFGDGNVGVGSLVSHEYKYPGDYVVVLTARAGDIFSVSRLKVKVAESSIFISDEGKYLEISNNGVAEVNLFNWKIESGGKGFIFQPNTIILPHSSIKLDKNLLTMKGLDNSSGISLKNCLKEEIFVVAPVDKIDLAEASKKLENMKQEATAIQAELPNQQTEIAKNDLVAGSLSEIATSSDNIIYEAPKSGGFISRLTNFIKRVFSK
jgi:hypothetical protein